MALNENAARERDDRLSALVHTPTFVVVAGALPGLFVATSFENGVAIGAVTAVAIFAAAALAHVVRFFTGAFSRTVTLLMLSATVVTLLGFAVRVTDPVVFEALGIYLPLACVGAMAAVCFVTEDGFTAAPAKGPLGTAVFAAVVAFVTLTFIGFINGMFTTGQVFGLTMGELAASPIAIFGKPAGSLLVLALVAVFVQSIEQIAARSKDGAAAPEGGER